jgi:cytochrome c-type biogenesis protein CcmH
MRQRLRQIGYAVSLTLAMTATPGSAIESQERLADPALESRARDISAGLRCVVCQNQSIDDSDAPLARDLRRIVREQLQKGASDSQVREYLVARYGDFVLLSPPFKAQTLLLWAAPAVLLGAGAWLAYRTTKAEVVKPSVVLSAEEKAELALILEKANRG